MHILFGSEQTAASKLKPLEMKAYDLSGYHQKEETGKMGEMGEMVGTEGTGETEETGETGETEEQEVEQNRQEQTPLILIKELQEEMGNLRAEVHNLTDAIDAKNHNGHTNSLALTSSNIEQERSHFGNSLFIPEGGDEDTNAPTSAPVIRRSLLPSRHGMIRTASVLNRLSIAHQVAGEDETHFTGFALDDDTFTLMTISPFGSKSWILSSCSFLFQMTLASQILIEQRHQSENSSTFNIPFRATFSVRLAQFFSIALCLGMQSDILTSVRAFLILGRINSNWDSVIGRQGERKSLVPWLIYIAFPNTLKFVQGFLVLTTCLVIIIQADDIVILLKDFTALMVISEIDNVLFELALYGYLGEQLRQETERIKDINIIPNIKASASKQEILEQRIRESAYIRGIFLLLLSVLLGVWVLVIVRQENGTYFKNKYPNCGIENFESAKKHFGDGECYGGALNTLACKFEDGDCVEFNIAYPACKGFDNLTNVETRVGNKNCDPEFAIPECVYDGGDCCPMSIIRNPLYGDGQCNGGVLGTKECGYDDGDCNTFIREYPNCPLEDLSGMDFSDEVVFGNGICESTIYASDDCGYEYKDCGVGQIGQDITFSGVSSGSSLYFSTVISKDGSKVAVGMPRSNKEGKYSFTASGRVLVYQYDSAKKRWLLEDEFFGSQDGEWFGFKLHMSSDAKQIVIGSPRKSFGENETVGEVSIFRFNERDDWARLSPSLLPASDIGGFRGASVSTADNGSRLAISTPFSNHNGGLLQGVIQIFDFNSDMNMWDQVGQDIYGKEDTNIIGQFYQQLNPEDGSRIFFSSGYINSPQDVHLLTYEFNHNSLEWEQIGIDIPNPFPTKNSPAMSADGNLFAMSSNVTDGSSPGQVQIYQIKINDLQNKEWKQLGPTLKELSPSNGDGFGTSLSMSADGDYLAISTVSVNRRGGETTLFPTGHINLFRYRPNAVQGHTFVQVPSKHSAVYGNIASGAERFRDLDIVGTDVSLSADGSRIFITGFDPNNNYGFVKAYLVKELFYDECIVPDIEEIGNGSCYGIDPYISLECGYDGKDCATPKPVPGLPDCILIDPSFLGDGACNLFLPFTSKECEYDRGDCPEPSAVEGYPNCFVSVPRLIGNGHCDQGLPYNSFDCGFDGGDCKLP